MTNKYCPQGEIKKLEIELRNLKVKGNDVPTYTERFQELTLICNKFVANETEKIDKYISGLPNNIYGSVRSSRPKTLDETIELANDFMDQKLRTYAEGRLTTKRKDGDLSQKQTWVSGNTNVANTQKGNGANPKGNGCFECGASGHFKKDCPKLKNKNEGSNLGSFEVIIGKDWLRRCHAVIVCDEKLVRVPYGNETLTFHGNKSNDDYPPRKGGTSQRESKLKDVPVVRDFLKSRARSSSTVSISSVQNEGVVETTTRTFRQGLHKAYFLALGSPGLVCQKEGWVIQDVHRDTGN
ncbi:putative reverse transcriptase domain-containing protein [Tanacetum coccineum]